MNYCKVDVGIHHSRLKPPSYTSVLEVNDSYRRVRWLTVVYKYSAVIYFVLYALVNMQTYYAPDLVITFYMPVYSNFLK